ncbi:hypothetical protein [Flavobacterium faecale]|uniref:hypothetical protein n=1 Tax=Flavobacterium faecale TaxID=1355330 RepID=UPI003AAECE9C
MSDFKINEFKVSEETKQYRKEEEINLACEILSKLKGKSNAEIKDLLQLVRVLSEQNCQLL